MPFPSFGSLHHLHLFLILGEIITFDQLALRAPTGKNTLMIQGKFGVLDDYIIMMRNLTLTKKMIFNTLIFS